MAARIRRLAEGPRRSPAPGPSEELQAKGRKCVRSQCQASEADAIKRRIIHNKNQILIVHEIRKLSICRYFLACKTIHK